MRFFEILKDYKSLDVKKTNIHNYQIGLESKFTH
jgi:hypothetical protein